MNRLQGVGAVALALLLSGCLEPFPSHVDAAVVPTGWTRVDCPKPPPGKPDPCEGNRHEVDYIFNRGAGPPYRAILQVLSLRDLGRRSTDDLIQVARDAVEHGTAANAIDIDRSRESTGTRTLRNGLETRWFTAEGNVTQAGSLLQSDVKVRIIGEVAYDGRSQTSVVAIGIAQVAVRSCHAPLPVGPRTCTFQNVNHETWIAMVGDAAGTVGGAVSRQGLIDHLVTHG